MSMKRKLNEFEHPETENILKARQFLDGEHLYVLANAVGQLQQSYEHVKKALDGFAKLTARDMNWRTRMDIAMENGTHQGESHEYYSTTTANPSTNEATEGEEKSDT